MCSFFICRVGVLKHFFALENWALGRNCRSLRPFHCKPPDFLWRPPEFHCRPPDFYWRLQICVRDLTVSLETLYFHWRQNFKGPSEYYVRPQDFHWRPQYFIGNPRFSSETSRFSLETPDFRKRPLDYQRRPPALHLGPRFSLQTPRFSLETSIFSLENTGIFSETPRFSPTKNLGLNWKYLGSLSENLKVTHENWGFKTKISSLQRKSRGSPIQIWMSPKKIWGLQWILWSLLRKSWGLRRTTGVLM